LWGETNTFGQSCTSRSRFQESTKTISSTFAMTSYWKQPCSQRCRIFFMRPRAGEEIFWKIALPGEVFESCHIGKIFANCLQRENEEFAEATLTSTHLSLKYNDLLRGEFQERPVTRKAAEHIKIDNILVNDQYLEWKQGPRKWGEGCTALQ
jgi:hypothetical protein